MAKEQFEISEKTQPREASSLGVDMSQRHLVIDRTRSGGSTAVAEKESDALTLDSRSLFGDRSASVRNNADVAANPKRYLRPSINRCDSDSQFNDEAGKKKVWGDPHLVADDGSQVDDQIAAGKDVVLLKSKDGNSIVGETAKYDLSNAQSPATVFGQECISLSGGKQVIFRGDGSAYHFDPDKPDHLGAALKDCETVTGDDANDKVTYSAANKSLAYTFTVGHEQVSGTLQGNKAGDGNHSDYVNTTIDQATGKYGGLMPAMKSSFNGEQTDTTTGAGAFKKDAAGRERTNDDFYVDNLFAGRDRTKNQPAGDACDRGREPGSDRSDRDGLAALIEQQIQKLEQMIALLEAWMRSHNIPVPDMPDGHGTGAGARPAPEVPGNPAPRPAPEVPSNPVPTPAPEVPGNPAPRPAPEVPSNPAPTPAPEVPDNPAPRPAPEVPSNPVPEPTGGQTTGTDLSALFYSSSGADLSHAVAIANALPEAMKQALKRAGVRMSVENGYRNGKPQGQNNGLRGMFYADSGMGDQAEVHELYEMYGQITKNGPGSWSDPTAIAMADKALAGPMRGGDPGDLNDTIGNMQGDGDLLANIFTADFFATHPELYQDSYGRGVLTSSVADAPELAAYIAQSQGLQQA